MAVTKLVSVFATEEQARAAARDVEGTGARTEIGSSSGAVASLQAEMQQEMDDTIAGPGNVGPFTKEMSKGVALGVTGWAVICAGLALPLALVPFGDVPFATRLAVAAALGAVTGATIGFVFGGGKGAEGPHETLAAERGVTLVIEADEDTLDRVASTLAGRHPIRLDRFGVDGSPDTVRTEEDDARK